MSLLAVRESGPLASRQVETFLLAQGAAFDVSGNVALNTTHRTGDGSDHADVALNSAHRAIVTGNPHGTSAADVGLGNVTNDAQLKRADGDFNSFGTAALALTDIILLESSGGAFAKIKATLQALKDLIGGGGGGGGKWTEIDRATITPGSGILTFDMFDVFSDLYDIYLVEFIDILPVNNGQNAYWQVGYGLTPTWITGSYLNKTERSVAGTTAYAGSFGSAAGFTLSDALQDDTPETSNYFAFEMKNLRSLSLPPWGVVEGGIMKAGTSLSMWDGVTGNTVLLPSKSEHLRLDASSFSRFDGGTIIISGGNL